MSRYMTAAEIAAEQELLRTQSENPDLWGEQAAQAAPVISDADAREVTPVDLLSASNYVDKATRDARFDICRACDRLFKPTATCKSCGCFMAAKTWLRGAHCALPEPDRKW